MGYLAEGFQTSLLRVKRVEHFPVQLRQQLGKVGKNNILIQSTKTLLIVRVHSHVHCDSVHLGQVTQMICRSIHQIGIYPMNNVKQTDDTVALMFPK